MDTTKSARGRVLVCDDSLLMRKLVIDALTEDGWEVVGEAQDGQEAVAKYREFTPDAVTMDIVMPRHDGIFGLEQVMEHDPAAQVVMVSALNQTTLVAEAVRKGAQDFIVKPFLPEQLQETMRRLASVTTTS